MLSAFDPMPFRSQFPSLKQKVNDHQVAFFDGPGGTQTPQVVIDAMGNYLASDNSNLDGAFATSERTVELTFQTRQAVADFFNARQGEEIVFGQNMTSLTFAVSRAISRTWYSGEEIIVTRLDHDANITPWVLAAEEQGVVVRWLDFRTTDCTLEISHLSEILNNKTRLIAVTMASNAVGTIVDVGSIAKMAHEAGALVYVDAVHNTPHNPVDVQALDCDFLVASAYKFFGPHTGILYGKYELLDEIEAYKVRPAPSRPPGKWETGTQSFESLAGVQATITYLESIVREQPVNHLADESQFQGRRLRLKQSMRAIKEYEEALSCHFLEKAASIPGLQVYGITDVERLSERVPTFAIDLAGYQPRQVAEYLGRKGIFVWDGHYYAVAVMDRLGTLDHGGLTRIGFVHYNTSTEIDRVIDALSELAMGR